MADNKLTQQELMKQYQEEEVLKIAELDLDNHPENYTKVIERIALIEALVFEAKSRAVPWHRVNREMELKGWDKKVARKVLTDPRKSRLDKEVKAKAAELTKVEKAVSNWVSVNWADKDILDFFPAKISRSEIWAAIRKARGTTEPVLTDEQKVGLAEEEAEEQAKKVEEERAREERKRKYEEEKLNT